MSKINNRERFMSMDSKKQARLWNGKPSFSREGVSSIFSRLFFSWLSPLLHFGVENEIELDHIGKIRDIDDAEANFNRLDDLWQKELKKRGKDKANLGNIFIPFIGFGRFTSLTVLYIINVVTTILLPQLTKLLLQHIAGVQILENKILYCVIAGIFLLPVIGSICFSHFLWLSKRTTCNLYAALVVAIYRKSLRITGSSKGEVGMGKIVNIMATDASRNIAQSIELFLPLYILPIQFIIVFCILCELLNWAMLAVIGVVILSLPLNVWIFVSMNKYTEAAVLLTDKRVKLINEILNGIRVIKFYSWEQPVTDKIDEARNKELTIIKKLAYFSMMGLMTVFTQIPSILQLAAIVTYTLLGGDTNPFIIFTALPYFSQLQTPLSQIPNAFTVLVQRRISLDRISSYLNQDEVATYQDLLNDRVTAIEKSKSRISITNGEFTWLSEVRDAAKACGDNIEDRIAYITKKRMEAEAKAPKKKNKDILEPLLAKAQIEDGFDIVAYSSLSQINFDIQSGQLIAIVGAVGSGKSTLVYSILGELLKIRGSLHLEGTVALAEQQAWIMNATARENILFGKPYDEKKYNETVDACSLKSDFAQFNGGDKIQIGEKGINLSGGQKARINLARAVYADSDIIIMDDPLAAVDTHVSDHLFNECIRKKLANKTRILVTNQLHRLRNVDLVLFMGNNTIQEQGTYDDLIKHKEGEFSKMVTRLDLETKRRKSSIIAESVASSYFTDCDDGLGDSETEKHIVQDLERVRRPSLNDSLNQNFPLVIEGAADTADDLINEEEMEVGMVGSSVYVFYIKSVGWTLFCVTMFLNVFGSATTASLVGNYILTELSNAYLAFQQSDHQTGEKFDAIPYLINYSIAIAFGFVVSLLGAYFCVLTRMKGSFNMHKMMVKSIGEASVSFYDITPMGRILSRFSNDISGADYGLTILLMFVLVVGVAVINCCIAMAVVTKGYMLVLLVPVGVLYYYMSIYIQTNQIKIKRLESVNRSPIYSNFTEVLNGLYTIRAFREEKRFQHMNVKFVNNHVRAYLTSVGGIQGWMNIRLGVIGAFITLAVTLCALLIPNLMDSGTLGLALNYSMAIVGLMSLFISLATDCQSIMNSVERIKFYAEDGITKEESQLYVKNKKAVNGNKMVKSPNNWPSVGNLEIKDLFMGYREGPDVLKGLNLKVEGGMKIGIVGRTGSGKSSLMIALFRICEPRKGNIVIDGIDIAELGLHELRSKLGIIPQDPFIFSGSLRFNLDPFNENTDNQLWEALEDVQLKDYVTSLEGGLHFELDEGGSNLSVGQRQLICIARAILRDPKILVLDEATASIDSETDKLLQEMVRTRFKEKTVLTIAHRLDSIMDSDKILVMNYGIAAEFDTPAILLSNSDGIFRSLVDADGEETAKRLESLMK